MCYLLTAKINGAQKQFITSAHDALNMVRRFILRIAPMSETSADLQAMAIMNQVDDGKVKSVSSADNTVVLVIQSHAK